VPPVGANPLVAPTAVVREDDTYVLVLDVGLKPFAPDPASPFLSDAAEPAAIYRVDLGSTPPVVARATETGQFVFPTGMAISAGTLFVCDPGQPEVAGLPPRLWRALPHAFGVIIHFAKQRLPPTQPQRALTQRQILDNIRDIVDQAKPAHTLWTIVSEI
jgi:hypothetical protein